MKTLFIVSILFLSLFSVPRLSIAGVDSHGGGAFVCRDSNGTIKSDPLSVELLDLWEAKTVFKFHVVRKATPWETQAKEAIEKLRQWDAALASESVPYLGITPWNEVDDQRKLPYVNIEVIDIQDPRAGGMGVGIVAPNDTRAGFTKKGCTLEGAATFNDVEDLLVLDSEIVSKMSPTDYAALRVHEAVYRALRSLKGVKDSVLARAITGILFSTEPLVSDPAHAIPPGAKTCESSNGEYEFSLFLRANWIVLQFKVIHGLPVLDSSYIALPPTSDTSATDRSNRIRAVVEDMLQGKNPTFFIGPPERDWKDNCLSMIHTSAALSRWSLSDWGVCLVASASSLSSAVTCR